MLTSTGCATMLPLHSARPDGDRRGRDGRTPLAQLDANSDFVHPKRELAKPRRSRGRSTASTTTDVADGSRTRTRSPFLPECSVESCLRGCVVCMPKLTQRQQEVCDHYFRSWRQRVEQEKTRALCSGDHVLMVYHNDGEPPTRVEVSTIFASRP